MTKRILTHTDRWLLHELRELDSVRTEGLWYIDRPGGYIRAIDTQRGVDPIIGNTADFYDPARQLDHEANAAFICGAAWGIPYLLMLIDELVTACDGDASAQ